MTTNWIIRPLFPADREAAVEIFYHGLYNPGDPLPDKGIMDHPVIRPYLKDFPSESDIGFVGIDPKTGQFAGAVYCRFFQPEFCGAGFYREDIPELSIGMMPAYRNQGCGTVLMAAVLAETDRRNLDVSLNCNPKNPALRLYTRFDFSVIASRPAGNLMLRRSKTPQSAGSKNHGG